MNNSIENSTYQELSNYGYDSQTYQTKIPVIYNQKFSKANFFDEPVKVISVSESIKEFIIKEFDKIK